MKLVEFLAYLLVATFVLFTGSSFVSIGFAFQGTLLEAGLWSALTAVGLLVGYAAVGGLFSAIFRLQSFGRIGEFVIGAAVGAAVLFALSAMVPATIVMPTIVAAMVAGSIGSALVVVLGAITGRLNFSGNLLPRKKAK